MALEPSSDTAIITPDYIEEVLPRMLDAYAMNPSHPLREQAGRDAEAVARESLVGWLDADAPDAIASAAMDAAMAALHATAAWLVSVGHATPGKGAAEQLLAA